MTRNEFIEEITDFGELRSFCCDHDLYDFTDNLYDDYERDDAVNDYISECIRDGTGWKDLRDGLNDISDTQYWHRWEGGFDWVELTDEDFSEIKDNVLEYCDDNDIFDEDPEQDDADIDDEVLLEDEEPETPAELPPLEIDSSIEGFLNDAVSEYETALRTLQTIAEDGAANDEAKLLQVISG